MPWSCLKWRQTLRDGRGDVDLSMGQALRVYAATELGRVTSLDDVRRAIRYADQDEYWRSLMAGARGLRQRDAAGDMTLREIFRTLRVTGVAWHFSRGASAARADALATLASIKGAA